MSAVVLNGEIYNFRELRRHGRPFDGSSAVPTFLLTGVTHREVTVALSDGSGDKLFAGHEQFAAWLLARRDRGGPSRIVDGTRGCCGSVRQGHRWCRRPPCAVRCSQKGP
jgi:hypothetical protein